ncbi:hypothetical protein AX17_004906 [Amanita inopinata Kibby_2008]|nr:hypothetical protein AX17_004906 [Amanita inopinata Kibby_2008]
MPIAASRGKKVNSDDPLDLALRPPPGESQEERANRLLREEEAKKISQAIDAQIKAERHARRRKRIVRLLLLGQSESGKSTTLRQFQRLYTPTAFREERILWRAVIQLNVVRSIRIILDAIANPYPRRHSPKAKARRTSRLGLEFMTSKNGEPSYSRAEDQVGSEGDSDSEPSAGRSVCSSTILGVTSPMEALKLRLLPLRHVETFLIAKLVPPNEDEATHLMGPTQSEYPPVAAAQIFPPLPPHVTHPVHHRRNSLSGPTPRDQEIFIRPSNGWKGALARARVLNPSISESDDSYPDFNRRPMSVGGIGLETPDEAQDVLYSCRQDIIQLWYDEHVREILRRKKIRLEESSGFFLNDIERITSLGYTPSDDDVLRARLKTVGVSEYRFTMEVPAGRDYGAEWRIIDVGGSRSQVATWAPFFDDVDAIIFLAPISGFDQVLAEDKTVNRLEDSVLLWRDVCSNKFLANVDLILFLNKCDILEAKLTAGTRIAKYVRSYGDRENDFDTVSKYLKSKFSAIHREYSPNPRKFYAFCTSVTDTTTTSGIIASVRDMVIRRHLKQSKLL